MDLSLQSIDIGVVNRAPTTIYEFEWKVLDFSYLSEESDKCYLSPTFSFAGASWKLCICPNGFETDNSVGYVGIGLGRVSCMHPVINIEVSFSLKSVDEGESLEWCDTKRTIKDEREIYAAPRCISREELFERESDLIHDDIVTVLCRVKHGKSSENEDDISSAKCPQCKKEKKSSSFSGRKTSIREKRSTKPTKHSDGFPSCCWHDDQCPLPRAKAVQKLVEDLEEMMASGVHSDITLKVKDEDFQLHKNILSARSAYSDAMLRLLQQDTGTVTIDDYEPGIFRSFIQFIYTGKADNLSPENVSELYEIADDFQTEQLKEICVQFMINSLSVDNFCHTVIMSLKHNEEELFEKSATFFANKTKEIISSEKWVIFLKEYPVFANELHIKALDFRQGL